VSEAPLVSVVTCFLDAERFIEEAVESVFAQTHPAWELVLVDDGSGDRSGELARRYARRHPDRVRCIEHGGRRNLGKSASRNAGIAASSGPYVAFLDADDVYEPHALATLCGALADVPEAAVAYGRTRLWHAWPGNPDGRDAAWDFDSELPAPGGTLLAAGALLGALVREDDVLPSVCSALVRRDALERVGGWEAAFVDVYDDFVLWAKLFATAPALVVDATLSRYRKHGDSSCERAVRDGTWSPHDLNAARHRYLAWLDGWLTRRRLGDEATWRALDVALAPYRHPTAPVAVTRVEASGAGGSPVHGHLDAPVAGARARSHRVPVGGWVAGGQERRALAVELAADGRTVRRVALDGRRPDVAAALDGAGGHEQHGFATAIALTGTTPLALDVHAVLDDQARVPLGRIAARRLLRPEDRRRGGTPVSVIVVCRTEAGAVAGALESALAQDHRPLDVVLVDAGSSSALEQVALAYPGVRYVRTGDEGIAAARRAGLARSGGELVLFLSPRERLHRSAVSAALRRLAHRPECAFVAGAGSDRPLDYATLLHHGALDGAVLYRRFALAAAGGIPDALPGTEEAALQLRVARHFAGIAIADPLLSARPAAAGAPAAHALLALLCEERAWASDARERRALHGAVRRARAARPRRGLRRRLRRPAAGEGRGLILLYHRIAQLPADPWALGVARERFAEQLAALRAEGVEPLALHELLARARRGRLPRRAVAVTFDDGYRDNLDAALPELEAAGVPATLFLASDCVGREREPWWDELERILLSPGELPARLQVDAGACTLAYALGDAASYDEAAARRHAGWRAGQPPPTPRHRAYAALWHALVTLDDPAREAALDALRASAGDPGGVRESHRTLEPDDVAALARSDVFEVGAHTIAHPRLAALAPDRQAHEIAEGARRVEELTGRPARLFAYPFGGLDDYAETTVRLVADAGFDGACATWEGTVHAASDPWQLPRVQVDDIGGEAFAQQLGAWFER